jgi:hypothetical protein
LSLEEERRQALLRKLKEDLGRSRAKGAESPGPRLSEPVAIGLPSATLSLQGGAEGEAVGRAVAAGLMRDQLIASIRGSAQSLLQEVANEPDMERIRKLGHGWRPGPGDFGAAFAEGADEAAARYPLLWGETPLPLPGKGQTSLIVTAATPEMLLANPVLLSAFPGSYREVLPRMVPGNVWIRWKFVRPGATSGMAYDGLVWLGDRFRWIPKPWRLFS